MCLFSSDPIKLKILLIYKRHEMYKCMVLAATGNFSFVGIFSSPWYCVVIGADSS